MLLAVTTCWFFLVCYLHVHGVFAFDEPLTPLQYQRKIGTGFSTNYFKNTKELSKKYQDKNIDDIADKGFKNLRLRCRADLLDLDMDVFLDDLEHVVDKCISRKVAPIISWIHHEAEAFATKQHHEDYIDWWTQVADRLKYKNYLLSYNLFTELGVDACGNSCEESLRKNTTKYNIWTKDVVNAIRQTQGNNADRIILLTSPSKTARGLDLIDESIYKNDSHMMVEWHIYASGPNQEFDKNGDYSQKYWMGNGIDVGMANVDEAIEPANDFTSRTGILTYLGAWMPQDNENGDLEQWEVINFAKYFVYALDEIPWSLNVLDVYYNTKKSEWLTEYQNIEGQSLNMSAVLQAIKSVV